MKDDITLSQVKVRCDRILRHFGALHQIDKCKEELTELLYELTKFIEKSNNKEAVQTEIADVLVTSIQMALLFGWDSIIEEIKFKLKRTEKIIEIGHEPSSFNTMFDALATKRGR